MPPRPARPCTHPGCPELVTDVRPCPRPGHTRRPWHHAVPSRHARGYGSKHVADRRQVLFEEPVCRYCGERESKTMDHIIPRSQGGGDERSNLAGACKECQQRKAQRESVAARGGGGSSSLGGGA